MTHQGIDFGAAPGQSVVTMSQHGLRIGDRIRLSNRSNRFRHYVVALTVNSFDLVERVRPSRGYARHVRRIKQQGRGSR